MGLIAQFNLNKVALGGSCRRHQFTYADVGDRAAIGLIKSVSGMNDLQFHRGTYCFRRNAAKSGVTWPARASGNFDTLESLDKQLRTTLMVERAPSNDVAGDREAPAVVLRRPVINSWSAPAPTCGSS